MLGSAPQELRRHAAWLALPFFIALVFGLQGFIVTLPYHWDEAVVYYNPMHEVLTEGVGALLKPGIFLYHPPGMQILAWPFYWALGDQPAAGRIFSGLMTSLGLYFTFLIGRRQVHWFFGLLASLLLFSSVRFFPHALQFHADIVLFGLGCAYIYTGLTCRFAFAFVLGLLCGLVRETALAFGLALAFFYLVDTNRRTHRWLKASTAAAPLVTVGVTFALHRLATGRFFNHRAVVDGHISLATDFVSGLSRVLTNLASGWFSFLPQVGSGGAEIYLMIVLGTYFLAKQLFNRRLGFAAEWAFLFIFCIFLLFFSFNSGFLPRYLLPAYPFFLLFILGQGWQLCRWITALMVVVALFTNPQHHHEVREGYFPNRSGAFEYSMDFPEMIRLNQEMANYLDSSVRGGSKVLTGWPFNYIFLHPKFGYVKNKMIDVAAGEQGRDAEYIIDGSCLPQAERSKFEGELPLFTKVQEFSRQGMWVILYKKRKLSER